jgi:hypothetical protein
VTTHQVFTIAFIGGLAAVLGLALAVLLAWAGHAAIRRLIDAHDTFIARRHDLKTCRAIASLGTTGTSDHPKH